MVTQECRVCGATKPITDFFKNSGYANNYSRECKVCEHKRKSKKRQPNNALQYIGSIYPGTHFTVLKDLGRRLCQSKSGKEYRERFILVRCQCGEERELGMQALKAGNSTACQSPTCHLSSSGKKHKGSLLIDDGIFFINKGTIDNFKKGAQVRGIAWDPQLDDGTIFAKMWKNQGGRCSYTGISIPCGKAGSEREWSPQRIDANGIYTESNLTLVHTCVNIMISAFSHEAMDIFVYKRYQNLTNEQKNNLQSKTDEQIRQQFHQELSNRFNKKIG